MPFCAWIEAFLDHVGAFEDADVSERGKWVSMKTLPMQRKERKGVEMENEAEIEHRLVC